MPTEGRPEWLVGAHDSDSVSSDLQASQTISTMTAGLKPADRLARTIESVVIPHMLVQHGLLDKGAVDHALNKVSQTGGQALNPDEIVASFLPKAQMLVDHLLDDDQARAFALVRSMLAEGIDAQLVLIALLAPAAKILGELWEQDSVSFADVTIAVTGLTALLRDMRDDRLIDPEQGYFSADNRCLVISPEGEDHTFGLHVFHEMLRLHGWCVTSIPCASLEQVVAAVSDKQYRFVGLSCGGALGVLRLQSWVDTIRQKSCNAEIGVFVGGPICGSQTDFAASIGADAGFACALDALKAVNALRAVGQSTVNTA